MQEAARLLGKGYSRARVADYMELNIKTIDAYRRQLKEQAAT
jgi:DNA-binding CsgD family transcriptional regulator